MPHKAGSKTPIANGGKTPRARTPGQKRGPTSPDLVADTTNDGSKKKLRTSPISMPYSFLLPQTGSASAPPILVEIMSQGNNIIEVYKLIVTSGWFSHSKTKDALVGPQKVVPERKPRRSRVKQD